MKEYNKIEGIITLILQFLGYFYLGFHLVLFTEGVQYFLFSTLTFFLILYRAWQINGRGSMDEILEYYSLIFPKVKGAWIFLLIVAIFLPILIYAIPFFFNLFGPQERISVVITLFLFILTITVETLINEYDRSLEKEEDDNLLKSEEDE